MTTLQLAALIVTLTALLAYVNARYLQLPSQIGLMAITLASSIAIVALDAAGVLDSRDVQRVVTGVDFGPTLLHGFLGFLLFAGALNIRFSDLAEHRWPIALLSLAGTVMSTLLVGGATYLALNALGHDLGLLDAMLFGALISPTDPIAVLGVLKSSRVPQAISVQISGESLFNDGIGIVVFTTLVAMRVGVHVTAGDVAMMFVRQAVGGAAFGVVLGLAGAYLLRRVTDYHVDVLLTLAVVLGGYVLAESLVISAPIAVIVAGIIIGNIADNISREHLDQFWVLIDEILNAVLFLLLGLEATQIHFTVGLAAAALVAVPIALGARFFSVATTVSVLRPFKSPTPDHAVKILTWGGLRGGLAVALALSLPSGSHRDLMLVMTYAVVTFAVLVQGLTLQVLLRRLGLGEP